MQNFIFTPFDHLLSVPRAVETARLPVWPKGRSDRVVSLPPQACRHCQMGAPVTFLLNIGLNGRAREREGDTSAGYSPYAHSNQGWARSKSGARNSFWVLSHEWQGSKYLSHRLLPPRMHISWKLDEQRSWSWNHNIDTGCRHAKWQLTLLCHTSSNLQF